MTFDSRYKNLNPNQRLAVDTIYGPLLVIAGPGTGKTELLSVRAANILDKTDVLPANILCLTFTDSGAVNMRERLRQIIGENAYKVAIHTFHSFGVEIINQHREFFFSGSEFKPADELSQFTILSSIFDSLDRENPLSTKNRGDFVYLSDVRSMISELKKSGLTTGELRSIINDNQKIIDQITPQITELFADKITKSTIEKFANLAEVASKLTITKLPSNTPSYASSLSLSIAHAASEAISSGKTNAITAWKNSWCTKDAHKNTVLKDSQHTKKLLAAIDIYENYQEKLNEAGLYDYDDMILNVIKAVKKYPELGASLAEQFQFIMVDEFQDTNLAQLRLLFEVTDHDSPNIMAVGDDDQAIFSFQGADVGNIQSFRKQYKNPKIIVLSDNYRSDSVILAASREVITQGQDRLENTIADLSKELTPWFKETNAKVEINEYASEDNERMAVTKQITQKIQSGVSPESIAVLAKQHAELISLLPYLEKQGIAVSYERRDDALDHQIVRLIEQLSRVVVAIRQSDHDLLNALLPELISHPVWNFSSADIWKLSLASWRNRQQWLEVMQTMPIFQPFSSWLINLSLLNQAEPIEQQIDRLIGLDESIQDYHSPIKNYFFSSEQLEKNPDSYLETLEALRTIRDQAKSHFDTDNPTLNDLIDLIDTYRQMNTRLTITRSRVDHQSGRINLMTAHKSKGLEFDHVFVIGATDNRWGEKARSRGRLIPYPANLPLQPVGNNYDERLRLFFVAMTRARKSLNISYSKTDRATKPMLIASFVSQMPTLVNASSDNLADITSTVETDWHGRITTNIDTDLASLLAPTLENYKLSVTHLNNFLDVANGGPQAFLMNNLLRFPQAKSPNASMGTAIHASLQYTHNSVKADGKLPKIESILDYFSNSLKDQRLSTEEFERWNKYGRTILENFINLHAKTFNQNQMTELNLGGQGVTIGDAKLTGALDLVDIDKSEKTIKVTDYKTGKPLSDWKGKTDYDKIKLHKYRQQLMFYQLLIENSRDYSRYDFIGGVLQFVEPDQKTGEIFALNDSFSKEELDKFKQLILAVWEKITTLDLPDISKYDPSYKGMLQFEEDLLSNY